MEIRTLCQRVCLPALLSVALVSLGVATAAGAPDRTQDQGKGKPSISLKVSPVSGFAPMRAVITAELKGGANDYEEFYCPAIEWDITVADIPPGNDPTARTMDSRPVEKSEQKLDCDPYEAGKSEIKRRFVREHTFRTAGEYNIRFNLKQKDKIVGGGRTTVRVRGGIGDGIGGL
jgi:hypothetical protein